MNHWTHYGSFHHTQSITSSGNDNQTILDFIGAKDDGDGGDNWSYMCKAPVKMSPSTNQHPVFYRPDALPVTQSTGSKHWRDRIMINQDLIMVCYFTLYCLIRLLDDILSPSISLLRYQLEFEYNYIIMPRPLGGGKIGTEVAHITCDWHHFQGQKVKGQGHQATLLTAVLARQAAAVVGMGTCWPWETAATLPSAQRCKAPTGGRGAGAYRGGRLPTACSYCPISVHTGIRFDNCRCIAVWIIWRWSGCVWYVAAVVVVSVTIVGNWCNHSLTDDTTLGTIAVSWAGYLQYTPNLHLTLTWSLLSVNCSVPVLEITAH